VEALVDRFQQDFGSILPEKGKKGWKRVGSLTRGIRRWA
jgi:hypothetical protein